MIAAGGVGSMVGVVVVPNADRVPPFCLGFVAAGVEALIAHQPLVALDLPVVPGRVDPGMALAGSSFEASVR